MVKRSPTTYTFLNLTSIVQVLTLEVKRLQHGAELSARSEKILAELRKSHIDVQKELASERSKMARLRHAFIVELHDEVDPLIKIETLEEFILGPRIR